MDTFPLLNFVLGWSALTADVGHLLEVDSFIAVLNLICATVVVNPREKFLLDCLLNIVHRGFRWATVYVAVQLLVAGLLYSVLPALAISRQIWPSMSLRFVGVPRCDRRSAWYGIVRPRVIVIEVPGDRKLPALGCVLEVFEVDV